MIKELKNPQEIKNSVKMIKDSFITVAREFSLTEKNCPSNAAFITFEKLNDLYKKDIRFFGLFIEDKQAGFIAVEKARQGNLFYIEKLAVLPEYRHKGLGKKLMEFAHEYVRNKDGEKISIGIIHENKRLKRWYRSLGYKEISSREFDHLPFIVCYMEKIVN